MEIRILSEGDAAAWWQIRMGALEGEPLAFGKAAEEHCETSIETIAHRFRHAPTTTLNLGAFADGQLVGTATFMRETGLKERHKGRVYAVYVAPSYRGKGVGRTLLTQLVDRAKQDPSLEQILISVAISQNAAYQLYCSLGFETYGVEPRALKVGSTYVDEVHMILRVAELPRLAN